MPYGLKEHKCMTGIIAVRHNCIYTSLHDILEWSVNLEEIDKVTDWCIDY